MGPSAGRGFRALITRGSSGEFGLRMSAGAAVRTHLARACALLAGLARKFKYNDDRCFSINGGYVHANTFDATLHSPMWRAVVVHTVGPRGGCEHT